jgi:hypothetical protein
MPLTEELSSFFNDFGVSCTAGAVSALGILDMPTQVLAGDQILSTDYTLTAKASDFGNLLYGDAITVAGVAYTVKEARLIDDGAIVELGLSKLATGQIAPGGLPNAKQEFGLADLADVDINSADAGDVLVNNGIAWVDAANLDEGDY